MTEAERKTLSTANAVLAKELPEEISKMLIGKGLTLAQAEAMLERAKEIGRASCRERV